MPWYAIGGHQVLLVANSTGQALGQSACQPGECGAIGCTCRRRVQERCVSGWTHSTFRTDPPLFAPAWFSRLLPPLEWFAYLGGDDLLVATWGAIMHACYH